MVNPIDQVSKVGKVNLLKRKSPNSQKYAEVRTREFLFSEEVEAMREVIRKRGGLHAHRDASLILLIYRHGLRLSESASLRWEQINFADGTVHIKRLKGGTPSTHPLYGDEIRALRKLQRDYPRCPFVFQSSRKGPMSPDTISGIVVSAGRLADLPFPIHAHMLRHGTGYYLGSSRDTCKIVQNDPQSLAK